MTLEVYRTAISVAHQSAGCANRCASEAVRRVMTGIRRHRGTDGPQAISTVIPRRGRGRTRRRLRRALTARTELALRVVTSWLGYRFDPSSPSADKLAVLDAYERPGRLET